MSRMARFARFHGRMREELLRKRRMEYHHRDIELSRLEVQHRRRMRRYVRWAAGAIVAVTVLGMLL